MKYVRDSRTGAVFLKDTARLQEFSEKQGLSEQIRGLKDEINSLKQTVELLKTRLDRLTESA